MHKKLMLIVSALILAGSTAKPAPAPTAAPVHITARINDLMDSMIDPSGDFVFESVAEIADEKGIRQKAPRTDEEWKEVRKRAFVLLEGMNLVMMDGRKVAKNGEK